VIDIAYCGVCHTDVSRARSEFGTTTYPLVPGHEIAGIVSAAGADVTRFSLGDRVATELTDWPMEATSLIASCLNSSEYQAVPTTTPPCQIPRSDPQEMSTNTGKPQSLRTPLITLVRLGEHDRGQGGT
jgi:hypothetical protein